jgi:hypothetical protein
MPGLSSALPCRCFCTCSPAGGGFPLASRAGGREHYYTAAAIALLHGRLYVPHTFIGSECFKVHGHCYGYFGITPSLLRLPAVVIAGNSATNSNAFEAAFYILGFLTIAAAFWWLARQLVEWWAPALRPNRARAVGFLGSVSGLGAAPLIFLVGRPLVYEEAILWGVAFAAVALAASVSVFRRPRSLTIVTLVVADLLAVSARRWAIRRCLPHSCWAVPSFGSPRNSEFASQAEPLVGACSWWSVVSWRSCRLRRCFTPSSEG